MRAYQKTFAVLGLAALAVSVASMAWAQSGPPATAGAQKLGPVSAPPFAAAAEKLPLAKLKVPAGFKVELYASGVTNARSLAIGDKDTVFVGSRMVGKVYALRTSGGKREVKEIATGLHRPNGVAFHNGSLYIAEISRISRLDKIEDNIDNPPKPVVINDQFAKDEPHGWKFIAVGPDNKLYVPVGAPGNNLDADPNIYAHVRRMNLDGSGTEVIAQGIRNTVGFAWHPASKELYFTDNGRDWVSEDLPEDELNRITASSKKHYGFPFCHQGDFRDPEFGWGTSCESYEKPVGLLGPHAGALGMRFYTGDMFPAEYKNAIFIARHGSWNKTDKIGGDVLVVKLNADGTVKSMEPFLTGFLENNGYIGRPVDVQVMKDGALLLSDDFNGAVYRISYGK